jgi:cold-inducible RNA-binding protein
MADRDRSRSRSRSPDRSGADGGQDQYQQNDGAPPENGGNDAPVSGDQGGGGGGDGGNGEEVKLYVGNLDYATNEDRLREEFAQFGTVTEVFLPTERGTQRPRGFGFVTLATREAAENAISRMDQAQLDGRTIRVNESRPKGERGAERSSERGGGGGGATRGANGGGSGFNTAGKEEVKLCKFAPFRNFVSI